MLCKEIINESLSRIAYHYTGIMNALKIVTSNKFELSSVVGNSTEEQYAPKGYPYFLSTTRTKLGGYHEYFGNAAVMFELNGDYYNRHYPSKSVDYWLNRNPMQSYHRAHEAEDRLFSKEPSIPANGITSVYVYLSPHLDSDGVKANARQLLIACKKRGLKTYFYNDPDAWKRLDKRPEKQGDLSILTGKERIGRYNSMHKGYLLPWIELIRSKEKSNLSKKANELRYGVVYDRYMHDTVAGLKTELSNARKPTAGVDRKHAVNIIDFMRQNRLDTVEQLVKFIADKWKTIG